ncbi:DUF4254 domain-containing protein [Terriglobus sp. RCC_193]|uniref:DUF4254 domain-containing protein n=1 Tax=Terriglobus sp. RCC_193 TaxID=3239218 RepID=UPI003524BCA1
MLHADTAYDPTPEPTHLLDAQAETLRFAEHTARWHVSDSAVSESDLSLRLHRSNFDLWHLEDRARDTSATDAVIANVKRAIDQTNQRRNDLVEEVDNALMTALIAAGLPNPQSPLHSETPGMILDRLSILSLKIFHTAEETERQDASEEHRARSRQRLSILKEQRAALTGCLADLWQQVVRGERRFQLYRQMKMYNDPTLNPVLYAAAKRNSMPGS